MNTIGKSERTTQNRIIQLFENEMGYDYLGDWEKDIKNQPVEEDLLLNQLKIQGYSEIVAEKAVSKFMR
jgi:type I restriction enzyme R subunit